MKEIMSLITFGIWALFLVVFFAALKPDVVIAVTGPSKPGFTDPRLRLAHLCRSVAMLPRIARCLQAKPALDPSSRLQNDASQSTATSSAKDSRSIS